MYTFHLLLQTVQFLVLILSNVQNSYNFIESVASGFGTSVGFAVALLLMASIRERIEGNDIPKSFRGMPIVLITAGLMSIAFIGFSGVL